MYVNIVRGGPVQKTIKDNSKHCGRQAGAEQLYRDNYLIDGRYKISLKRNLLDYCERQRRNRGQVGYVKIRLFNIKDLHSRKKTYKRKLTKNTVLKDDLCITNNFWTNLI
jgi:hypothetical protein